MKPAAKSPGRSGAGKASGRPAGRRFVLVTGSARRLGRDIALRFAASGHFVFIHYRGSRRAAEDVLKAARAAGGDGALVSGDLSSAAGAASVARGVRAGLAKHGAKLDVLVNNVGVYETGPLLEFDPDRFDAVLRANLTGCFRLARALLPSMPRGGNLVNIGYAGVESLTGTTHNTAYLISKTGLLILTKSLAQALGPRGIRVNMVSPGILSNSVELPENPAAFVPLGALGDVSDVTDAVEYLTGAKARYVTGVNLDVAGGYHLGLKSLEGSQGERVGRGSSARPAARAPRRQGPAKTNGRKK